MAAIDHACSDTGLGKSRGGNCHVEKDYAEPLGLGTNQERWLGADFVTQDGFSSEALVMQQTVLAHLVGDLLRELVMGRYVGQDLGEQVRIDKDVRSDRLPHQLKNRGFPRAVGTGDEQQYRTRIVRRGLALFECGGEQLVRR